jgi:hypothetical protein
VKDPTRGETIDLAEFRAIKHVHREFSTEVTSFWYPC